MLANWEDKEWMDMTVKRGQFVRSRKNLAQTLKISGDQLREVEKRLKATNELTTKSTNKYTIYTLVNYELYQDTEIPIPNKTPNEPPNEPQTNPKRTPTTKEVKELKEESTPSKKRFIRPSLEEVRRYVADRGNKINPDAFFNYYESIEWMRGRNKIKNWKACVLTWEAKEKELKNKDIGGQNPNGVIWETV